MRARLLVVVVPVWWCLATPSLAAGPAVAAAESEVTLGTGFANTGSGLMPSLIGGISLLHPVAGGVDGYAGLSYRFSGGTLAYRGHNAFNQVEARLGAGFALRGSAEIIPYAIIGYQAWNRTAFYRATMAGAGAKFDVPVSPILVLSLGTEFLALAGGNAATGQAVTPEEHVALGLDGAAYGNLHVFAQAWWTRFSAAEPLTTEIQSGVNLGIGYSFY